MGVLDWIIITAVAALLILAVLAWRRNKSCGKGCSGDCANCERKHG